MIHEIGRELQAGLRARGCPFTVYSREPTGTTTWARQRVVIEHDGADSFSPVHSQRANPRHRRTRSIAVKITIYAQATAGGAKEFEHRRRAEQVLDLVVVCLDEISSIRKNGWSPKSGRFIQPPDLAGSELHGGAVYEFAFTFDRAIIDRTWTGDAQPEAALGAVSSMTKVSGAHGPDDDNDPNTVPAIAETACGA